MLPLSDHALFEISRRGIDEKLIREVYFHPQQKILLENGREIWQNKIEIEGKIYVVRIVVEFRPETRIVTAYKSSKVKKYWREES